jgi:hypothetical protein
MRDTPTESAPLSLKIGFIVDTGNTTYQVEHEELAQYAHLYGLENLISGRYSWLFVFHLMMGEQRGISNPHMIIDEIKNLEGISHQRKQRTKPASEFKGAYLKGLWHKHFFFAHPSVLANNIKNHLAGGKLKKLVEEVFNPDVSPIVTKEMVGELSHRIVHESLKDRGATSNLTGEWIIFAKHQGRNYYLCLASHIEEDKTIAHNIKLTCLPQFPFLSAYPAAQ